MDELTKNPIQLLKETRFAEEFPESQLLRMSSVASARVVRAGEVLFREGELHDGIFIVHRGRIRLAMHVPGRGDIPLLTAGPGELVGWSSLISDSRMTASAVAVEDSLVVELSGTKLKQICESDTELGYRLLTRIARVMSQRILATRMQLLDLFGEGSHR